MYSFPYLEPVFCSMSSSRCCFLTCIQISQEVGRVVWYSHLFQNFPQVFVIHTVKGFGVVDKADVFLKLSWFCSDATDVGNLILVPLPLLNPPWTSGSSQFTYCWSLAWRILSITLLTWDYCNYALVWAFFGIAFLWDWNENWPFSSPVATAEFSKISGILSTKLSQHYLLGFEITQVEFHHLH